MRSLSPILIAAAFWWHGPLRPASADPPPTGPAWERALPGRDYEFPRDHFAHPGFKTEWWYFTGQLAGPDGEPFGFQVTFFRQGLRPPGSPPVPSRFVRDAFHFGHFALSDLGSGRYEHAQVISRGAFGEAGNGKAGDPLPAWLEGWELHFDATTGAFRATGGSADFALDLTFAPTLAPVLNGEDGVSQKSAGEGQASHYYSMPRLETTGSVRMGTQETPVTGLSWLDREWGTSQLAPHQVGWDWFALHLDDGRSLMLYRIRDRGGEADPFSSGTLTEADGSARHLLIGRDFDLVPGRRWESPQTGGRYPLEWEIHLPAEALVLSTRPRLDAQEFAGPPVAYWEGAIAVEGTADGTPVTGQGYLEMTGYAGELGALRGGSGTGEEP